MLSQVYIAPAVFELVCVCGRENNFIIFRASFLGVAFSNKYHGCEMPVPWL